MRQMAYQLSRSGGEYWRAVIVDQAEQQQLQQAAAEYLQIKRAPDMPFAGERQTELVTLGLA